MNNVNAEAAPSKPKVPPKKAKVTPKALPSAAGIAAAAKWLDAQVGQVGSKISAPVVDLTPDIAAALLERNPNNRSLSKTKVDDFTHDMKNGDWKLNGEPVIIASDGSLNDGQHRCYAVMQSGVTVKTVMIFGVERETRDTLDQGKNRLVGDYLYMLGKQNANHLAAAARMLWQWQNIGFITHAAAAGAGKFKPTRTELIHLVQNTPSLVKSLDAVYAKNSARLGSIGMVAFCHYAMKVASNESAVTEFVQSLVSGAGLEDDDPRLYCRNRLMGERGSMGANQKVELIFRTWNAYRLNEKRSRIGLLGGELPMLES